MKTIAELAKTEVKSLVTSINTAGGKIEGLILETGLKMFVIARAKPADVGLKKFLTDSGVDAKKAPQNAFQVARSAFLIGADGESQPALEDAPRVSEAAFVAAPTRTLMAVSACLNALEKLVEDQKIPATEASGHEAKLCGFIVSKDTKGAKEYLAVLRAIGGEGEGQGEGEGEELLESLDTPDAVLRALAACAVATGKVEWKPEESGKFRLLVSQLIDEIEKADAKRAPVTLAA